MRRLPFAALMFASLVAIAGESPPLPTKIAPPSRIPRPLADAPQPTGNPVPIASVPRAVRKAVVADAARRFEVAESAVVLGDAEQLTWSDGSLGCPQPGMRYTQMLVPGFRLTATTPEGKLLYHTDSRARVVTCVAPRSRKPCEHQGATPRTPPPSPEPER